MDFDETTVVVADSSVDRSFVSAVDASEGIVLLAVVVVVPADLHSIDDATLLVAEDAFAVAERRVVDPMKEVVAS